MIDAGRKQQKPRKQCITGEEQAELRYIIEEHILAGMTERQLSKAIRGTKEFGNISRETIRNNCKRIRMQMGEARSRSMDPEKRDELIGLAVLRFEHIFKMAQEAGQFPSAIKALISWCEVQGLIQSSRGINFSVGVGVQVGNGQTSYFQDVEDRKQGKALDAQRERLHVIEVVKNLEHHGINVPSDLRNQVDLAEAELALLAGDTPDDATTHAVAHYDG